MPVNFVRSTAQAIQRNPRFTALMVFNVSTMAVCAYPQLQAVRSAPKLAESSRDSFTKSRPITDYLGSDLRVATFRQGKTGDCYLLSGLDAVQHHPLGKTLLSNIRVIEEDHWPHEPEKTYTVCFPSGESVTIHSYELGMKQGDNTPVRGPEGIQLLELAYGKLIRGERNKDKRYTKEPYPDDGHGHELALMRGGLPSKALSRILVGDARASVHECFEDPEAFRRRLYEISRDKRQEYVLCALTENAKDGQKFVDLPLNADGRERSISKIHLSHCVSMRSFNPDSTVTVADPHDTEKKVDSLTRQEFSHVFACISGIRFKTPKTLKPEAAPPEKGRT